MARFTKDTKLKELVKNDEARAILQERFPIDLEGSTVKMAYGMSLEKCLSFPGVEIDEEGKAKLFSDLEALG